MIGILGSGLIFLTVAEKIGVSHAKLQYSPGKLRANRPAVLYGCWRLRRRRGDG